MSGKIQQSLKKAVKTTTKWSQTFKKFKLFLMFEWTSWQRMDIKLPGGVGKCGFNNFKATQQKKNTNNHAHK